MLSRSLSAAALVLGLSIAASSARAQTFPADGAYTTQTCGGATAGDQSTDANSSGGRNVIGVDLDGNGTPDTGGAAYVNFDDNFLYLRMRVTGDPRSGGANVWAESNWHWLIDSNNNPADGFEWMGVLLGRANPEVVQLRVNTTKLPDVDDVAETVHATYSIATHTQYVSLGNNEFFVGIAIPLDDIESAGATYNFTPFGVMRIYVGTSNNVSGDNVNIDVGCTNADPVNSTLDDVPGDPTPIGPFVTFTSPTNGAIIDDSTPTLTGTSLAGTTVTVSVDGGAPITATVNPVTGAWTLTLTTPLSNGDHTLTAVSDDGAGHQASASITITYDDDPDNDGLASDTETTLGTNPNVGDTDGDGDNDGVEVGGNPGTPLDTDGDTIIDALESTLVDTDGVADTAQLTTIEVEGPVTARSAIRASAVSLTCDMCRFSELPNQVALRAEDSAVSVKSSTFVDVGGAIQNVAVPAVDVAVGDAVAVESSLFVGSGVRTMNVARVLRPCG